MFIVVLLFIMISIHKVLLKPTIANSELSGPINDDETRFKRQTAFFDLLHQAIEKYANCADIHLAPLKSLANFKQYESYAEQFAQSSPPRVGAMYPNHHRNGPNLRCTKVNLCYIQNQHSHSPPGYNGDAAFTRTDFAKQYLRPYFPPNTVYDKTKIPISGSNHYGFKNIPATFSTNYSGRNNFKHLPLNQALLNNFLFGPSYANRVEVLKAYSQKTNGAETIAGSAVANTSSASKIRNCPCLESSTVNQENKETKNKTEILLSNKLDNVTVPEKVKGCSCLKDTYQAQAESTKTEPNSPVDNSLDNKLSSQESSKWNQNLNQLFQQLDVMAHKENNGELKGMLEKLKSFKSAFKINSSNEECANTNPSTTTTKLPAKKGSSIFTIIKEKLFGGGRPVKNESIKLSRDRKKDNDTMKAINLSNNTLSQVYNFSQFNGTNAAYSSSSLETIKNPLKPPEPTVNTTTIIKKTISLLNDSNILQNLADIKSAFLNLNDSRIKDSMDTLTNSTTSTSNLANSQDLLRIKELLASVLLKADKNIQSNSQTNHTKITEVKTKVVSSETNQTSITSDSNKATTYNDAQLELFATNLNKSLGSISPISHQNDTKITISITSNGNFKNIQVEHQLSTGKNLEINEKENMHTATSSSKVRSMDMMGTGSRYVNVLKQPEKKGPYTEPILSELYSGTSRFRTKPPLSIYWHKIDERPLKLKRISSNVWKTRKSADVGDNENTRRNKEYLSTRLRKGIDFEDVPYYEKPESWVLT